MTRTLSRSSLPVVGLLRPESDRAEWWRGVFGSLDVPLRTYLPYKSGTAGFDKVEDYYQIDVSRLTPEQFDRVCHFIAEKFALALDVVRDGVLGAHGLPIRASEIAGVIFTSRTFP